MSQLSQPVITLVIKVGRLLYMAGVPRSILPTCIAQVCFETGWFKNQGFVSYNNYSGIKYTDDGNQKNSTPAPTPVTDGSGGYYAVFNSPLDWAVDYVRILSMGSTPPIAATDSDTFVQSLKANGYFTSDLSTYEASVDQIANDHITPIMPAVWANTVAVIGSVTLGLLGLAYCVF